MTMLTENEREVFIKMYNKYKDYDKVDFLIHKTLKYLGVDLDEFNNRRKD